MTKFKGLLPQFDEVKEIFRDEPESNHVVQLVLATVANSAQSMFDIKNAHYMIKALQDKCWERIHTGHFTKDVSIELRKIYTLCCIFKIFFIMNESSSPVECRLEECSVILDSAILIGCTENLYANYMQLQEQLTAFYELHFVNDAPDISLPNIESLPHLILRCDVPQLECPSVEVFCKDYFEPCWPVLLQKTISHWPALVKWRNLNYILQIAGNRTVPIEFGSNYVNNDWSQQLVRMRDFLRRQFAKENKENDTQVDIEYLAQHELFDQIPLLKNDIRTPDYCLLTEKTTINELPVNVDVKAWFGPKGTISPMHYDPKHNILCQVFGTKKILLVSSECDKRFLYPYESEFLTNTSRVDAENPNFDLFPLFKNVELLHVTLQEGECLYIPPKWWHYVRSNEASFSVSFWWE